MDDLSPNLTDSKIDEFITWLEKEKAKLDQEKQKYISVDVEKIAHEIAKKRLFYYVDFRVSKKSGDYIENSIHPFSIRENKYYKVDISIGTCVNKSSSVDFRLIFDKNPYLELKQSYSMWNILPTRNIEEQINRLEELKRQNSDFGLKSILFGTYKPKGLLDIKFDLRNNKLNNAQKVAISKSLQSPDFHLILGPPGTGKTTLIKELVEQNIKQDKRVLLTSWMNAAVDNALDSIFKDTNINLNEICRIGAGDYKMSETVRPFSLSDDFKDELPKMKLVGVTLASAYRSKNDSGKKYDIVIVDEAGSSTVPQTLLALDLADKFILIGDHLQLPPVVKDKSKKWMTVSLFENLWKMYPEKHSMLNIQYRMNPHIAKIASDLVYSKFGGIDSHPSVSSRATPFDTIDSKNRTSSEKKILCKNLPICWVEVNGKIEWKSLGNKKDRSAKNILEIGKIRHIVDLMIQSGIDYNKIGILSPFRLQISTMIKEFEDYIEKGLSVDTIHSFQGNEKDIVIISLVEKDCKKKIFSDIRILNVALTRAKYKLIIVGNSEIIYYRTETSNGFLNIWRYANTFDFDGMNGVISPSSFEATNIEKLSEISEKENKFIDTMEFIKKEKRNIRFRR